VLVLLVASAASVRLPQRSLSGWHGLNTSLRVTELFFLPPYRSGIRFRTSLPMHSAEHKAIKPQ